MRTPEQVQTEVLAIQPAGFAWPEGDPDTYSAARWLGLANELSLAEASMESLLPQIDPRTAPDLLADYQRVLGPDPCRRDQLALTTEQQALLAFQRWTGAGGNYAGWFAAAGAAIGEAIGVIEYAPTVCGGTVCGQLSALVPVPANCDYTVVLPAREVTLPVCGSTVCGDTLGTFTPDLMACVFTTWGPLGRTAYFTYGTPLLLEYSDALMLGANTPLLLH